MKNLAPVVLFVYNRPWHTEQTLENLSKNFLADESILFIYADGPKKDATQEELAKVNEVRDLIRSKQWCKEVNIKEKDGNQGLTKSVIEGVTEVINIYGRVIVLEDDLLTSSSFIQFMNTGLDTYQDVQIVHSINGYMFPIKYEEIDTVLLPYVSTWGWATWSDSWKNLEFNVDDGEIISNNKFLTRRFNLGDYDYLNMLLNAKNSWGIYWYLSVFKRNGLSLFPTVSLVENIGFDGSGTNSGKREIKKVMKNVDIPMYLKDTIDLKVYDSLLNFFTSEKREEGILEKLRNILN